MSASLSFPALFRNGDFPASCRVREMHEIRGNKKAAADGCRSKFRSRFSRVLRLFLCPRRQLLNQRQHAFDRFFRFHRNQSTRARLDFNFAFGQ